MSERIPNHRPTRRIPEDGGCQSHAHGPFSAPDNPEDIPAFIPEYNLPTLSIDSDEPTICKADSIADSIQHIAGGQMV
jgi:hypothetical protein